MSPRTYRMKRRREATDRNRRRILKAAREILAEPTAPSRFSLEEVARRAGVARMTVYYQFGSLVGLLRALCDSLAMAGGMSHLADAFRQADPLEAVDRFIAVFMDFWQSDRPVLRTLGALAILNPEIAEVLEERYQWRRRGVRVLLERVAKQTGRPRPRDQGETVDLLYMLTSFSTYDMLASRRRSHAEVTRLVQQLARRVLASGAVNSRIGK
jgi:AcrR family transcriptional regulator